MNSSIIITNLSHVGLFENFNLEIENNKCYAIMGRSGSGKTTLLKSILRSLLNTNINIGFLPQNLALFERETVFDNLCIPYKVKGLKIKDSEVEKYLNTFELVNKKKEFVYNLSGGEKQRIALIRSIITKPDILLLDEPFSKLDINTKEKVIEYLKNLDIPILFVTHIEEESKRLDSKIINMSDYK